MGGNKGKEVGITREEGRGGEEGKGEEGRGGEEGKEVEREMGEKGGWRAEKKGRGKGRRKGREREISIPILLA